MDKASIIGKTREYVKKKMDGEGTGHDWFHVERVWKTAKLIAQEEKADYFVVELAALLHDIADWKFHNEGDMNELIIEWLEENGVDEETVQRVIDIITNMSFKGAKVENKISTIEGMVVQDADRLDALGAIGIARVFAYGGHKGNPLHDPRVTPHMHETFEQYKNSRGTSVNHFYEKLLLLKDRMNTDTGRRIAEDRTKYMEQYLDRFFKEWSGEL